MAVRTKIKLLIPTKIRTIVSDPQANIRDPTAVIFDPITETWNFWATRIPVQKGTPGYNGVIYHYYSKQLDATQSCFLQNKIQ